MNIIEEKLWPKVHILGDSNETGWYIDTRESGL